MTKSEKIRNLAEEELKNTDIYVPEVNTDRDGMDWVFYVVIDGERMNLRGETAENLAFDLINNL